MIKEVSRTIDQTAPHQLVVAKVLGALNCTELLRVIKPEGARPFATTTDGMSDMRGASDLVVSFDGGFKYGLAIEVKTTTQAVEGAGPFKLFKAVKSIERNQRQFERLINSTPAWWYLVVHIGKLTAKTISEMDRALLDCPAVIIEGQHADETPDEVLGVKPLGELLNLVSGRLNLLGALAPLPSPHRQLDLLVPTEDVPVVTLDTPLAVQTVWTAPLSATRAAPPAATPAAPRRARVVKSTPMKILPNRSIETLIKTLVMQWDMIGEDNIKARATAYPDLIARYEQMKREGRSALSVVTNPYYSNIVESWEIHNAVVFALALQMMKVSSRWKKAYKAQVAREVMPEAVCSVLRSEGQEAQSFNILSRVGHDLCRNP